MAEQVYLSGLDNLQRIAHTLASIQAIDEDYVRSRILDLKRIREPSASKTQELESLQARLSLKDAQRAKVDQWLAQNEQAMTQIDSTMAAIAALDTVRGHATTDLETAMRELAELARRAPDYSSGSGGRY
jgi:dsDNA-binding SOS-regulon protein